MSKSRWLKSDLEGISIVSCVFAAGCHVPALLVAADVLPFPLGSFRIELLFFLCLSLLTSVSAPMITRARIHLALQAIRAISLIIAGQIVPFALIGVELLIIVSFIVDIFLSMPLVIAGISATGVAVLGLIVPHLNVMRSAEAVTWVRLAVVVVIPVTVAVLSAMVIVYREHLVRQGNRLQGLSESVMELLEANRAFQNYAGHLESESATKERHRIARELHDSIGYALTNLKMLMNAGKVLLAQNPVELDELFDSAKRQTETALEETRRALYRLRAADSGRPKGVAAFAALCKTFEKATGVQVATSFANVPLSLGSTIDAAIYRFIQEGLSNSLKHGGASSVRVHFWRGDRDIRVSVIDNGKGGDVVREGIGINGMRERFESLGGTVEARGVYDGFELVATIPLEACERI